MSYGIVPTKQKKYTFFQILTIQCFPVSLRGKVRVFPRSEMMWGSFFLWPHVLIHPPFLSWLLSHCPFCSSTLRQAGSNLQVFALAVPSTCSALCRHCRVNSHPFQFSMRFAQTTFLMTWLAHPQHSQFPSHCSTFSLFHSVYHLLSYYIKSFVYDVIWLSFFPLHNAN